jgi:hypothetical protein
MDSRQATATPHDAQHTDKWEFRLLLALAMVCFFAVSVLTRLLPRRLRPFAAATDRQESCFEEARRMAYAVIPYAFEW